MDRVKGILLLLVVILGISTVYLTLKTNTQGTQIEGATLLAQQTLDFLRLQDARCNVPADRPVRIANECLTPLLAAKDFKEDAFQQPRNDEPGHVVILNQNRKAYDAASFTFMVNRRLTQNGCGIPGMVDYKVTCRFEFPDVCREGDVLEVFYPTKADGEPTRVFLKTC